MLRSLLVMVLGTLLASAASAQPRLDIERGERLYQDHCDACHNERIHWRAQKQAQDWAGLKVQVRRWQAAAALGWSEADVSAVSLYLNQRFYFFPVSSDRVHAPGAPVLAAGARRP
ncbi:MAG: cytochrome C [Burkholderiales bacterium]|nr:cytochrome C [Burkholderiales bacterium]